MKISKDHFVSEAISAGIPSNKAEALWKSLEEKSVDTRSSMFSRLLYYLGALIVIGAMSWFFTLSWGYFGGGVMFLISLGYASIFISIGSLLWQKEDLKVPAGLLITIAVFMVPLAIYGLETYFNVWPEAFQSSYKGFYETISSSWILMDIGTIIAGLAALRFFSFPFITMPIFLASWFLIMDLTPLILDLDSSSRLREWISMFFGIGIISIAYILDKKKLRDYAFWGYLFGTFAFWGNLTSIILNEGELVIFIYLLINIAMMLISVLLQRKVLLILGAMGVLIYLCHLVNEIFQDSHAFPFILSFIGLLIIYLGVLYQRNFQLIEQKIISLVPVWLIKLLPLHQD